MKQSTIAGIEVGCTSARVCNDPRCRFNPKKASVPSQHKVLELQTITQSTTGSRAADQEHTAYIVTALDMCSETHCRRLTSKDRQSPRCWLGTQLAQALPVRR